MSKIAVIIVAAGRGRRFGGEVPKQYMTLGGMPVLRLTMQAFADHPRIAMIQPVIDMDDVQRFSQTTSGIDCLPPVAGGATRQASVHAGLKALAPHAPDIVLIHDAARPNVDGDLIERVIDALADAPGAIPALAVVDTLKRADDAGRIETTVPRDGLWRAQTPQGFRYADIAAAHAELAGRELTDDAALLEAVGKSVKVVAGDDGNIKVTTPDDIRRLEEIMQTSGTANPLPPVRIGTGFDVHRLGPGDGVILCGITVPSDLALIGHSDADVALHAITDAILGAIANGDIGSHFPPTEPQWQGASSDKFLIHACKLMTEAGYALGNIDLTVICEKPKVGPHRAAMRESTAKICGVDISQVSVKATTTEQLGFTGRGEGIAAQAAVTLIRLP